MNLKTMMNQLGAMMKETPSLRGKLCERLHLASTSTISKWFENGKIPMWHWERIEEFIKEQDNHGGTEKINRLHSRFERELSRRESL